MAREPYLNVDISALQGLISNMRTELSADNYKKVMYRAFKRTAEMTKTQMKRLLPQEYELKGQSKWIMSNLGKSSTTMSGANVKCVIPIKGSRGRFGLQFKASAPLNAIRKARKNKTKYDITVKTVKGVTSKLPKKMPDGSKYGSGDNAPFIIKGKGSLSGRVFVRKAGSRRMVSVVGLNIPRMPLNRSEQRVKDFVIDTLEKRITHEHDYLMKQLAGKI